MISKTLQIVILLAIAIYFLLLFHLLKRRRLNLKYSLLWIFSGGLMLLLVLFPHILDIFARTVGIYEPTNALFAFLLFCLIIILMSLTAIVSKMNKQIKQLAQYAALLEKRVCECEERGRT